MKVILIQDVKGTGKAGQEAHVADGYGRNFLIPRGMAVEASRANINQAQAQAKAAIHRQELQSKDAQTIADRIAGQNLTFLVKCGEGGRLFGSVTAQDIADRIKAEYDIEIDRKKLELSEAIKSLGAFQVTYRPMSHVSSSLTIYVLDEENPQMPPQAEQPAQMQEA